MKQKTAEKWTKEALIFPDNTNIGDIQFVEQIQQDARRAALSEAENCRPKNKLIGDAGIGFATACDQFQFAIQDLRDRQGGGE